MKSLNIEDFLRAVKLLVRCSDGKYMSLYTCPNPDCMSPRVNWWGCCESRKALPVWGVGGIQEIILNLAVNLKLLQKSLKIPRTPPLYFSKNQFYIYKTHLLISVAIYRSWIMCPLLSRLWRLKRSQTLASLSAWSLHRIPLPRGPLTLNTSQSCKCERSYTNGCRTYRLLKGNPAL